MPAEITQENVRLLIPGKAARVASLIAAKRGILAPAALLFFYRSRIYQELARESSKYWHYSPEQLFAISGFVRRENATYARRGPGRSALLPYKAEILHAWRRERLSARAIAERLAVKGVQTTPQNVWKFIQRHLPVN